MKGKPVVEAAANEGLDALDVIRRKVRPKHDLDRSPGRQLDEEMVGLVGGDRLRGNDTWKRRRYGRRLGGNQRECHDWQRAQSLLQSFLPEQQRRLCSDAACLSVNRLSTYNSRARGPLRKGSVFDRSRRTSSATAGVTNLSIAPP